MSQPVIEIKNLSKKYRIDHYGKNKQNTIWDVISNTLKNPTGLITGDRAEHEAFWALKDINLTINRGDVVGIIGKNGSGKSTMLKVLSRIIEPTTGSITMQGRVASLLEVGTGFHPELTGRENIYFNGSILGMSRKEINSKFHDIVEFSEIEKFLDTPVKFYSSGMYVRLAFSVAAHLDPDVLIVDEVLAVGDASFQKKSLGKMKDVAKQGRTVLFVSHSMQAVSQLCNKGMYLKDGQMQYIGEIDEVISKYTEQHGSTTGVVKSFEEQDTSQPIIVKKASLLSESGKASPQVAAYKPWKVSLDIECLEPQKDVVFAFGIRNMFGSMVRTVWSTSNDLESGKFAATVIFNDVFIEPGKYEVLIGITSSDIRIQYFEDSGIQITVTDSSALLKSSTLKLTSGAGTIINQIPIDVRKI